MSADINVERISKKISELPKCSQDKVMELVKDDIIWINSVKNTCKDMIQEIKRFILDKDEVKIMDCTDEVLHFHIDELNEDFIRFLKEYPIRMFKLSITSVSIDIKDENNSNDKISFYIETNPEFSRKYTETINRLNKNVEEVGLNGEDNKKRN